MIYRNFKECNISLLGMGCMRLPCTDDKKTVIDMEETRKMVDYAIKNGVNYFDSAWPYHGGNSETAIGTILQSYPRDSFYYATKFPGHSVQSFNEYKEIFQRQLERSGLGYFDFYLFHNVCEADIEAYRKNAPVLIPFLKEQKEKGIIRHIGFSMHGKPEIISQFLDTYGDVIEFCQIQLNWLDWNFIDAKENVDFLNKHNIPIWVMEPMRGGRLASLPKETAEKVEKLLPNASPAEVAFRYLQSIPGVKVVLTGASSFTQMKENIAIFEKENPLTEKECRELYRIQNEMQLGVPCTSCGYCIENCSKELNIPKILSAYNDAQITGNEFIVFLAVLANPKSKRPMDCIHCQECEKVCPQGIKISEVMKSFTEMLENSTEARNPFRKTK